MVLTAIFPFIFTPIPMRLWHRVQLLIPIQMRKFVRIVDERHLVRSMERRHRWVACERIKCVSFDATLLREALPKRASFLVVLVLVRSIRA
jgi:hypothetical protein